MKIVLTGGGTAGHVTPLLAVASEIKKDLPDAKIIYIGKKFDGNLNSLVRSNPSVDKTHTIFAGKLRRFHGKKLSWYLTQPKLVLQNIRDLLYLGFGTFEAVVIMIINRPKVVFVKGGYVGLPVGLAAVFLRIPIVTHDSDTHPGLTNRVLSRYATKIGVGQPIEHYHRYPKSKMVYCGVPVKEIFSNPPSRSKDRTELGMQPDEQMIAVIGGSLGAVRLNKAVLHDIKSIAKKGRVLYWLSGYHHFEELNEQVHHLLQPEGRVVIEPFVSNPERILNAADVVVSRTGATFLAELAALKKATILVPNPLLTGGHQVKNAVAYEQQQAALVIQESELANKPQILANKIDNILDNQELKLMLEKNISKFAVPDSAAIIARLITNVGFRQ